MAKFLLSNVVDTFNKVVIKSEKAGFVKSGESNNNVLSFCVFDKLNSQIEGGNFLQINDDFVSVTGSCIYKEKIGIDSLKMLYADFTGETSIKNIRDRIIGNCAIIIKKDNSIYVFGETFAIYSIYFSIKNGRFTISNSLADVAEIMSSEPDWANLQSFLCFATIYCGGTIFKDIYRLTDDKCIILDCKDGTAKVMRSETEWRGEEKSYSEIVDDVAKNLITCARVVSNCYGTPALCSTGGLDNRVNLASFLANGVKPNLYYGKGNSSITNTDNEDNEINKIYKERFGLEYQLMEWNMPDSLNQDWEDSYQKYGMDFRLYSGSKDIYGTFENISNEVIFFGYYGEMYRNLDFIENLNKEEFNIDEYIDRYLFTLFDSKEVIIKDMATFREHIKTQLVDTCNKWGINPLRITRREEQYLSLERRNNSDSGYINWVNYHHYCLSILAQPKVMRDVMNVDADKRKNGRFMLDVLSKIYPDILEIPVYSHRRRLYYDKEKNVLSAPENKTLMERFLAFGRPIQKKFIGNKVGRYLVFKIYWLLLNDEKKKQIIKDQEPLKMLEGIINEYGWKRGVNYGLSKNGRILKQLEIAQNLWAYGKINKK